jgi:adenine phosphoribosyltransferase
MTVADDMQSTFAWVDGHADVWRLFADAKLLRRLAPALADPFRSAHVTHVVGIAARGFLLRHALADVHALLESAD